jgi:acetyl-CoA carboxylase carboxyl transferase subunit alpha
MACGQWEMMETSAFTRVQLARHPERPQACDLIARMFEGFTELHGDRRFADDPALLCGPALFRGRPVMVIAQQKGRDTDERRRRNFGMSKPEGYRKALRAMRLAEKFGRPVVSLIDTPGAYPGVDAEERGQAEAIAVNLREMARLRVPLVVAVIGEGGSGGALGIGVGDYVLMLENAIYSVISPEGCAAILWKDAAEAPRAAEALRLTAQDLLSFRIIDRIVAEPAGGAHRSADETAHLLAEALEEALEEQARLDAATRVARRYERLRALGVWLDVGAPTSS